MTENRPTEFFQDSYRNRFILRFSIFVFVAFGACSALLYYALDRDLSGAYADAFLSLLTVRSTMLRFVIYSSVLQALFLSVATGALAVFTSHRIAGPVYKMRQYLAALRRGEQLPGGLRLRAGDQMKAFASAMDSSFTQLTDRCKRLQHDAESIADRIDRGQCVEQREIEELQTRLSSFRLD
ncbi:MAG: hypothetical protein HYX75_01545 [Acidobacteria bacterium]|nr:hypothetical protein [Acidobacteriota bacterium]